MNAYITFMWFPQPLAVLRDSADGMESWTTISGVAERNPGYQYVPRRSHFWGGAVALVGFRTP